MSELMSIILNNSNLQLEEALKLCRAIEEWLRRSNTL